VQPRLDCFRQRRRANVEAQMDGGRNLVDVLPARALGPDCAPLDLRRVDRSHGLREDAVPEPASGLSASPGSAPALGSDEPVVERGARAGGAILAGVEDGVIAELRRVRALGRLGGIRLVSLYFSLIAAGSDSLIRSAATALPLSSALAKGAAAKPVTV